MGIESGSTNTREMFCYGHDAIVLQMVNDFHSQTFNPARIMTEGALGHDTFNIFRGYVQYRGHIHIETHLGQFRSGDLCKTTGIILALHVRITGKFSEGIPEAGDLATFLLGTTFISAGLLASSVTDNQIVAAVLSFFGLLLLWMVEWSSQFVKPAMAKIIRSISLLARMEDMNRGVIDTSDILFYLSATVLFLYLTYTVTESRRWRQ